MALHQVIQICSYDIFFWLPQLSQDCCASHSGLYLLPWLLLWDRSDFHGLIYEITVISHVCDSLQIDLLL